jgi:hypothetical protein
MDIMGMRSINNKDYGSNRKNREDTMKVLFPGRNHVMRRKY